MLRDRIIDVLRAHADEIKALGVEHLALFGSVARGDAGPNSDVDVVVDVTPGRKFSLIDLAGVRLFVCDILERETDVVVDQDLRARFRERIGRDRVQVF